MKNKRRRADVQKIQYMQEKLDERKLEMTFVCLREYAQQKKQHNADNQRNENMAIEHYAKKLMSKGFITLARYSEEI